jgi:hypothetical protein
MISGILQHNIQERAKNNFIKKVLGAGDDTVQLKKIILNGYKPIMIMFSILSILILALGVAASMNNIDSGLKIEDLSQIQYYNKNKETNKCYDKAYRTLLSKETSKLCSETYGADNTNS